ncbi:4Fe-4S ferredoxin [Caldimicrobium thiodismutans]|uniref:4Fe-4S ferredoxin n=1 Tax=Caldimicrobium thiodismutans TaxID=1653476 RepID=A0A0U4W2N4_9BACT|nr:4Fe-4S binding protein [Caldimicrobium thiodismutans]BAU23341.1 4Fe-4S ferredoxin [Caldimicrobium thiodismutans]
MRKKKGTLRRLRYTILFIFFILLVFYGIRHQVVGGGPAGSPSIHAYCPFGGLETAYLYFTSGEFLRKLYYSNFILLGAVVLLAGVTGAGFCGWICPFGAFQEWLNRLGKKVFKKTYELPKGLDRALRYMKYLVLAVILLFTYKTGKLVFEDYDPFFALFHFKFEELTVGLVILLLLIPISLFLRRAWCRYFCPLGAFLSFFNWMSRFKIIRKADTCVECGACKRVCQMAIQIEKVERVPETHCIKCLECVEVCKYESLILQTPKFLPSTRYVLPVVILILFLGTIGISMASGFWKSKAPAEVAFKIASPDEIRGWMTLRDVARIFHIPEKQLTVKFSIPEEALDMQIRKLDKYGIKEEDVRHKVKELQIQTVEARKKAPSPEDIAGWMTLEDVSVMFDIPVDVLKKRLGLKPEDSPKVQLKSFNDRYPHFPKKVREEVKKILEERKKF